MDLEKKQLELQRDSVVELKERFEKVLKNQEELLEKDDEKLKRERKKYKKSLERQQTLTILKSINKKVVKYKERHFNEPFKYLVRRYKDDFNKEFNFVKDNGVEYKKNIENFISTPLSISLVKFVDKRDDFNEELKILKRENSSFKELKIKDFRDIIKYSYSIYKDDFKELFLSLKETKQFCSALVLFIPSLELSYILLDFILQIQQYENEKSDEFDALSRQNRGDELFGKIKRYFKKSIELDLDFIDDEREQDIAQILIDLLIELKYLKEERREEWEKNYIYLNTTKEFEEKIKSIKERLVNVRVRFKPMVVPPREWKDIDDGGFLKDKDSSSEFDLVLIKHNIYNRLERKEILKQRGKLPKKLLQSINTIQRVPYKINEPMLKVIKELNGKLEFNRFGKVKKRYYDKIEYYQEFIKVNKINSLTALKEKLINHYEDMKLRIKDKEKREEFNVEKIINRELRFAKIVLENRDDKSFWIDFKILQKLSKLQNSLSLLLEVADEFKSFEKIYFVWQIDFRGRIYPVQTLLNPQGGDIAKSLLLFAKEQELTERGIFWFKIHGANLFGEVDKEIFEKREEWVSKNSQDIIDSANNPLNHNFWKKADEPFEFLAFCFEYKRFIENPDSFTTSLPVAIDGSNNGLQHISTLLRDVDSAKKVNVLPAGESDKVEDIYKFIANTLKEKLKDELERFKEEKEALIKKGNLYYQEEEKLILDKRAYSKELIEEVENLDILNIGNKKFATALKLKKDKKEYLEEIEEQLIKKYENISKGSLKKRVLRKLKKDYEDFEFDIEDGVLNSDGKRVEKKLELDVRSLIEFLLEEKKIDRKFVKKPVMTDSYGSTIRGKADKIFEEIEFFKNKIELEDKKEVYAILKSFSNYLAKLIEDAIAKNSQASVNYEIFIKKVADLILKTNNHIHWKTPLGFKVQQLEYKTQKASVNLADGGKITIRIFEDKVNKRAHKQGILPNFVHSLDATHLYMTVNSAKSKGVEYFMTVHDSFATLPNDMDRLVSTLKEEFINLYKEPILENLVEYIKDEFNIKTRKKTLKVPYINRDEFDFEKIKEAKYFFA